MPDELRDSGNAPAVPGAEHGYTVRSVARAIAVLRAFSSQRPELSLAEVAQASGLDKGTARRLLVTLRDENLIRQEESTQRYCLGPGILDIARAVPRAGSLADLADDVLRSLARDTQTTVFLIVRRGPEAVCLGRYVSDSAIQVRWWDIGVARPMNCGAAARLLLAFAPEEVLEDVIVRGLVSYTPKSRTDPAALRADMAAARARGWELAVDDVCEGLAALAVPVKDDKGDVIATISVSGLTPHLVEKGGPIQLARLREAAAEIEARLYSEPPGT